jgi:hypothetical protein
MQNGRPQSGRGNGRSRWKQLALRIKLETMPLSHINDPKHWRGRAEEARTLADHMNDTESKAAMLRIAQDYERLAEWTEQRGKGLPRD